MDNLWERLFIGAARVFGWSVLLTPLAVVAALVAGAFAGQQRPDLVLFVGNLAVQLFATVVVGVVGAAAGASIGIGTAILTRELITGRVGQTIGLLAAGLSLFPAVVLGWFGATLLLPELFNRTSTAVFVAACAVVTLAVIPRSNRLAVQALASIPAVLRESASAAGASAGRLSAHVLLPASKARLTAIYADALSRSIGEAAAVSIVFLAAARAGYSISPFTIGGSLIAHAYGVQAIDAGIAQSAILLLALAVISKIAAVRRMQSFQWVL
jgi:ABC-type phosphate transport system permease subunit